MYGYQPSLLGAMGPEFATIVTAIDNRGYCVCKVSALGKITKELLVDFFEDHLDNPAFICSDANLAYKNVCEVYNLPHYVKPSNYDDIIRKHGYVDLKSVPEASRMQKRMENDKLLDKLYFQELIDYIENRGNLSYPDLVEMKKDLGLNLGRVNELHKNIKNFINKRMTNVSTKYLQDYIGFFTYIRNWRVTNGKYPTSSKDAEQILIEVLKKKVNYTYVDTKKQELELPKPSSRYVTLLAQHTEQARIISNNKYFKFSEEDGVRTFNKREYLLAQPNIGDIILKLISEDQSIRISYEDLAAIAAERFRY